MQGLQMKRLQIKGSVIRYIGMAVTVLLLTLFFCQNPDQMITAHADDLQDVIDVGFSTDGTYDGEYLVGSDPGKEGGRIENSDMILYYQIYGDRTNLQVAISGYYYKGTANRVSLTLPGYINHYNPDGGDKSPQTYTLVGVHASAFKGFSQLYSVTFSSTYEWIGAEAFMNCPISGSLTFNTRLKEIRDRAFYGCSDITDATIREGVTSIGTGVFANCTNLKKIAVVTGNARYCSVDDVLYSKDKTELIQWPAALSVDTTLGSEYTIGSAKCPVRVIADRAFEGCVNLSEIKDLYPTVTTIGERAFYGCTRLEKAKIPDTVLKIGESAFSNCSPWLVIACNKGSFAETYAKNYGISTSVTCTVRFYDGSSLLKTDEVSSGGSATPPVVTERSGYTLTWDKDYTNVQQNLNVYTSWKQNFTVTFKDAFSGQMTEVLSYYGGSATPPVWTRSGYTLGWDTTAYNYVTKNLTVNAVWLVSMTGGEIKEEQPKIGDTRTINSITYQVTRTTSSDPRVKAVGCTKQTLTSLTIPTYITFGGVRYKVTNIGENAFRDMPDLKKVVIGKSLIKINKAAFYNCPRLSSITIYSKKITGVATKAFSKTYANARVNVPNAYIKKYKSYLQDAGLNVKAKVF